LSESPIRILVVEDFAPFRAFVTSALDQYPEFEIIGELSDGLEAVSKAAELNPDLILLDIGLPSLNGIAAARRIREHSPQPKILFVSGDLSPDIVEQALSTGAAGYLVKSDAGRHLLPAVRAVLEGEHYLSSSLSGFQVNHNAPQHPDFHGLSKPKQVTSSLAKGETAGRHEVVFYSNDRQLLDRLSRFIAAALNAGDGAVVVATGTHQQGLVQRLEASGVDVAAAIKQSRYITQDASDTLSSFIVNGMVDAGRFFENFENLFLKISSATQGKHPRIALFGECVDLMWKQGNAEAAIQAEKLGSQLSRKNAVDILCAYSMGVQGVMEEEAIQRICSEHSAVYRK